MSLTKRFTLSKAPGGERGQRCRALAYAVVSAAGLLYSVQTECCRLDEELERHIEKATCALFANRRHARDGFAVMLACPCRCRPCRLCALRLRVAMPPVVERAGMKNVVAAGPMLEFFRQPRALCHPSFLPSVVCHATVAVRCPWRQFTGSLRSQYRPAPRLMYARRIYYIRKSAPYVCFAASHMPAHATHVAARAMPRHAAVTHAIHERRLCPIHTAAAIVVAPCS